MLDELDLPGVRVVRLEELEAHDRGCSTSSRHGRRSSTAGRRRPRCAFMRLRPNRVLETITYLDADLMFFSSPSLVRRARGRLGAHRAPPLCPRESQIREGERDVQRGVADLPTRRARPGSAVVVARAVPRVVLLPLRGRQDGRPEVPRRLAATLRRDSRPPASWRRPRALERFAVRARRARRSRHGGRAGARLLPLPLVAPLRADGPRASGCRIGNEPRHGPGLLWSTNYPASPDGAEADLGALPESVRRRSSTRARRISPDPGRWGWPVATVEASNASACRGAYPRASVRAASTGCARLDPWALRRYRDSWRNENVARQMARAHRASADTPEDVPPYRSFLAAVETMLEHDRCRARRDCSTSAAASAHMRIFLTVIFRAASTTSGPTTRTRCSRSPGASAVAKLRASRSARRRRAFGFRRRARERPRRRRPGLGTGARSAARRRTHGS